MEILPIPLSVEIKLGSGVRQAERDTIAEREAMEREEEEALERERQRLEARKLQTRDIVSDQISREEAAARAAAEVRRRNFLFFYSTLFLSETRSV